MSAVDTPRNDSKSPDDHAQGLTGPVDASRYDGHIDHPLEVAGMLRAMMPERARVLDVGCGTGSVAVIANSGKGNSVTAVEPDADRVAIARARGLTVFQGFLDEQFLGSQGRFDVAMASDVLEHTTSPSDLLKLMVRSLRPGGYILVSVPNIAHWSIRMNMLAGRFNYEPVGIMDATHLRWFTEKTVRNLFEQCGLDIIELRQTAGVTLPVYERGLFRRMRRGKRSVIRFLTRACPLLFGVQHVVKARVKSGS